MIKVYRNAPFLTVCGQEIFTEALLLATDFFVHYLRIFRTKDMSTARIRRKEILVQKLYRWLARTQAIEYNTEILRSHLVTNTERVFFKTIMAKGRLFRVIA